MKYSLNSTFDEIFDNLIRDANLSVIDENLVRVSVSEHISEKEYEAADEQSEIYDRLLDEKHDISTEAMTILNAITDAIHEETEDLTADQQELIDDLQNVKNLIAEV